MAAGNLPPLTAPFGIFQEYIAKQTESLTLKEKMFTMSGDDFTVKLASGQPLFHIIGNAFSWSGRKEFKDMSGNPLFTIRRDTGFGPTSFYCEEPNGNIFFEVVGKFSWGGSKAIGTFINGPTGQKQNLLIDGDWFHSSADIIEETSGQRVAYIDRHFGARDFFSGQQTYTVTVAQNVDLVLICAMCICMDERHERRRG